MDMAGLKTVSPPESSEYAMLAVCCDWQLDEAASKRKGEATMEPLPGALTVISAAYALVPSKQTADVRRNVMIDERKQSTRRDFITTPRNRTARMGERFTMGEGPHELRIAKVKTRAG